MLLKVWHNLKKSIKERRKSLKWDAKLNLIILNLQELKQVQQDFVQKKIMNTLYKETLTHMMLKLLQLILHVVKDQAHKHASLRDKFLISLTIQQLLHFSNKKLYLLMILNKTRHWTHGWLMIINNQTHTITNKQFIHLRKIDMCQMILIIHFSHFKRAMKENTLQFMNKRSKNLDIQQFKILFQWKYLYFIARELFIRDQFITFCSCLLTLVVIN